MKTDIADFPINTGFTYSELADVREILRVEFERTEESKLSKIIDSMDTALDYVENLYSS